MTLNLKYLIISREMQLQEVKGTLCGFTDYHTLRVGGLVFAGVIVVLSVFLLAGMVLKTHTKTLRTYCGRMVLQLCIHYLKKGTIVIVFRGKVTIVYSFLFSLGNRIFKCGKSKVKKTD